MKNRFQSFAFQKCNLHRYIKEPADVTEWEIPTRVACKQVYDPEVTASWWGCTSCQIQL